jgi:hypothetical protein
MSPADSFPPANSRQSPRTSASFPALRLDLTGVCESQSSHSSRSSSSPPPFPPPPPLLPINHGSRSLVLCAPASCSSNLSPPTVLHSHPSILSPLASASESTSALVTGAAELAAAAALHAVSHPQFCVVHFSFVLSDYFRLSLTPLFFISFSSSLFLSLSLLLTFFPLFFFLLLQVYQCAEGHRVMIKTRLFRFTITSPSAVSSCHRASKHVLSLL